MEDLLMFLIGGIIVVVIFVPLIWIKQGNDKRKFDKYYDERKNKEK
jgi:hypothetical protein